MKYTEIKDLKGRTLIHINTYGKVALSRFKDLSDEEIDELAKVYHKIIKKGDVEETKKFLRFEDEEKFCS